MKTPRVKDFDPDAKVPVLKSSLDNMPSIVKPQFVTPQTGQSLTPLPEKQVVNEIQTKKIVTEQANARTPVPRPVRGPVPQGVPLIPKAKRVMRQRQPFDIYEDQYQKLKKIADAERNFVNGRGMSQMVRLAIDKYLKDNSTSKE
jgi:hypothetical protein